MKARVKHAWAKNRSKMSAGTDTDRMDKKGSWDPVKVKSRWAWIKSTVGYTEDG